MEFLIAKTKENPSGRLDYQKLISILKRANIVSKEDIFDILEDTIKLIGDLEKKITNFEEIEKTRDYKKIIKDSIIKDKVVNIHNPINISYPPTIEKDEKIVIGTIYRDSLNNRVRIKMQEGWKTIKLED